MNAILHVVISPGDINRIATEYRIYRTSGMTGSCYETGHAKKMGSLITRHIMQSIG